MRRDSSLLGESPQRNTSARLLIGSALISATLALVYCVAKIDMAIKGDVGMPGIPLADPEENSDLGLVWLRQLGNAAVGFGAAVLALATLLEIPSRRVRLVIVGGLWIGFVFIAAGAGAILLRTAGFADSLGNVPLTWASGITNAIGVCFTLFWLALALTYTRHTRRIKQPA